MSIPKEPRQLMINLMYLVLTALLALNVSAEVMNAFFSLDKGMKDSGSIVDRSNEAVLNASTSRRMLINPTKMRSTAKTQPKQRSLLMVLLLILKGFAIISLRKQVAQTLK